jgi:hypothetical protein
MSDAPPPPAQMMQMVMGSWVAQMVGAAARLSIADHLAAGATTADEVAAKAGADADATFRLMRALASLGVLHMDGNRFTLLALGHTLRTGVPGSVRHFAMAETDTAHWLTWGRFTDAVRQGRGMVREALGVEAWDYYGTHRDEAETFSRAMADVSAFAIGAVLASYDFSTAGTIVDVGGAHGALLAAMLGHTADARGILFDLPHVVEGARPVIEKAGLAARVQLAGGSFLDSVPAGGDLYLLKHILHDWDDAHSLTILRNVRAAMKPTSKLIVVEFALPETAVPSPAHLMDLNMLVMLTGRERTPDQYGRLLSQAGLAMTRFIPTESPMGIVEAVVA